MKGKKDKCNFIKIKISCASTNTIQKVKRQLTEERNIANHISDKNLAIKIYKELLQPNNLKTNNPI